LTAELEIARITENIAAPIHDSNGCDPKTGEFAPEAVEPAIAPIPAPKQKWGQIAPILKPILDD
jgi:hypothetical protein